MTDPVITAIYDMPYAPDDYFYYEKSVRKLYRSGAQRAAEKFGQTEAALDVGHAYGQNIVTGFNETPTLDLAPVYIRLAGIEGAFLLDAASYAWGPEGMVVSSDLMLLGVTGYDGLTPPATSWLRLPAAPSAIGPAGATTIEASPVKANSINIPSGFDARNPAAVLASLPTNGVDVFREWRANTVVLPPALVLEQFTVAAGPYLAMREFEYGLVLEPETAAIAAGPVADFVWLTQVTSPAAIISVAGMAPQVSVGARVAVPSAGVAVASGTPRVATGVSIAVPTVGIEAAAVVPDQVGRLKVLINAPAAAVAIAAVAPAVVSGALVTPPAAGLTLSMIAPSIQTTLTDPNFSSVGLLLHMDGANNSTTFTDSSSVARSITANGNAKISTDQSKFGSASAFLDGSGDFLSFSDITVSSSADCTLECWFYRIGGQALIGNPGTGNYQLLAVLNGMMYAYWNGSEVEGGTVSDNTWHHAAVTRSSGTIRLFLNGTQVASSAGNTQAFSITRIGRSSFRQDFNGYIDDVRITVGVARYTANFTPPAAPFPDA